MKYIIIMCLLIVIDIVNNISDSVVTKISFDGLQRVSSETVLFYLPLKIGDAINNNDISDSIKVLFNTEYFDTISIYNNNEMILIKVKERPIISAITLQGNKLIDQVVIQQILDSKKIKVGEPLNNYSVFETKNILQDAYFNIGKFNSSIKIVPVILPKNLVDLRIIFNEGKTAKINQINIFGNHAFSKKQLLKQFKLHNRSIWNNIWKYSQYHKQKLLSDLETLRNFYLSRGYAKFYINDIRVDFSPNKNSVCYSIYITEGYQYSLQSVIIRGNILTHIPKIIKYLQISPGELYNHNRIVAIERNIHYLLGKQGYIHPTLLMEYSFDDSNKTIRLYIYVDVNNRSYVHEIRFEGNNVTRDSVIRRELKQVENVPLNYIYILEDQEKLRRFSYLKTVDVYIEQVPNTLNKVNVVYKIEERNAGSLNCSLGFGSESGINVQIGMIQENLLGSGDSVSIDVTKNNRQTYIDISMLKKHVGMSVIDIFSKIFYNNLRANKSDASNYNTKNYGANIDYSYPFNDYLIYKIGLDYISNYLSHIEPQIAIWRYLNSIGMNPEILVKNNCINANIDFHANDLSLISRCIFNNLNRLYFPEFGSHISVVGKLTLPKISNNQYYKIEFDSSHYLPLNHTFSWIVMSNLFAGYIKGFYNKESPFYNNFYLGGINTVRGFKSNNIGPKAIYYHCKHSNQNYCTCTIIKNSQDAIGGNAVVYMRNELIIPTSWISDARYTDMIRVSLFIDAGSVWDTYWKNTEMTRAAGIVDYSISSHIRISSGISVKWISPIGPIIFSYAKLLQKYPGDFEEPFQFSIGKSW